MGQSRSKYSVTPLSFYIFTEEVRQDFHFVLKVHPLPSSPPHLVLPLLKENESWWILTSNVFNFLSEQSTAWTRFLWTPLLVCFDWLLLMVCKLKRWVKCTKVNIFHLSHASSLISADYHLPYAGIAQSCGGFATMCAFLAYTGANQVENVYKN